MATQTPTKTPHTTDPLKLEALPASEFKLRHARDVDRMGRYRAVIQLGPRMSWCKIKGGTVRYERVENTVYEICDPYVAITPVITGETLLGLISEHNKWVNNKQGNRQVMGTDSSSGSAANRSANGSDGAILAATAMNQCCVQSYEPTDEPIAEVPGNINDPRFVIKMVGEIVKQTIAGLKDNK